MVANDLTVDLDNETPQDKEAHRLSWHPERAKMHLAMWVLVGIFIIFLLTIAVSWLAKIGYMDQDIGLNMFDICRTGLLPIVTLILGYYFSKNN